MALDLRWIETFDIWQTKQMWTEFDKVDASGVIEHSRDFKSED